MYEFGLPASRLGNKKIDFFAFKILYKVNYERDYVPRGVWTYDSLWLLTV